MIVARARKTHHNVIKNNFSRKKLLVLPYHDNFANIPHVIKTFNVNVCFKNNCTVNNKLIKNSHQCNEGCIYTVLLKNYNRLYIGQTGKTLEQGRNNTSTLLEHVRTGQQSHALFIHVRDTNYSTDWENCKKLKTSKSSVERNIIEWNIIESSLINHTYEDSLNLSEGLFKLDNYITGKISKKVMSSF